MITLEQIREKLITEIKNSGLSQTEIANKLSIKQPSVAKYLSGQSMPALDTFANLCKILDVSADDILGLKN